MTVRFRKNLNDEFEDNENSLTLSYPVIEHWYKMNIFDILCDDSCILVYSITALKCFVTWNKSNILQLWVSKDHVWEEYNGTQLDVIPRNYEEARKAAIQWLADMQVNEKHVLAGLRVVR